MRRERDRHGLAGEARERALDLGDVPVAGRLVGLNAALDLAHVRALGRLAPGARDARLAVDRDRRVEQAGLGERREGERRGRRVAAGIRDLARVEHVLAEQLGQPVGPVGIEPEVGAEVDDRRAGGRDRLPNSGSRRGAGRGRRRRSARAPRPRARRSRRSAPAPCAARVADARRSGARARGPHSRRRPAMPALSARASAPCRAGCVAGSPWLHDYTD